MSESFSADEAPDERVVRRLIDRQCPQWRDAPLRAMRTAATENATFRLGDKLGAV